MLCGVLLCGVACLALLSTGAVGAGVAADAGLAADKLIGPGHTSVVQAGGDSGQWFLVWHASIGGDSCERFPFTTPLMFGDDGWPYVALLQWLGS